MGVQNIYQEIFLLILRIAWHKNVGKLAGDVDGHGAGPEEESNESMMDDVAKEYAETSIEVFSFVV